MMQTRAVTVSAPLVSTSMRYRRLMRMADVAESRGDHAEAARFRRQAGDIGGTLKRGRICQWRIENLHGH